MKCHSKALVAILVTLATWGAHAQSTSTPARADNRTDAKSEMKVYLAQDDSARRVMENLLAMFGRKLIGDSLPSTPVSGRFEVRTVEDVMSYFMGAYQLNYFVNGVNVYVYKSGDWRTKRIYVGGNDRTNDDWKDMLTSAGLFYKEFPFVINREKKELVVSGPRAYLNLIESTFGEPVPDPSEIEKFGVKLMAFPLKHASVDDRQTLVRETTITTPGVLSVLLNLLGLPPQQAQYSANSKRPGFNVDKGFFNGNNQPFNNSDRIANMPLSSTSELTGRDDKKAGGSKSDQPVSITADSRTNTILIRDAGSRYDYYKTLIDQLDKAVPLIEVEAMMVEVDQQTLNELGLEFGLRNKNVTYNFPGSSVGKANLFDPGTISIVDPVRFVARLRALSADENVKVLARPTILTQDNVPAYIDLSQTIYLSLTGERVADVRPITAGSLLQVTPRMVKEDFDERIFIRIDIQDGSIADTSGGITLPRVQNTSISTQAVIPREKAILVGGYNRDSTEVKDYKVPVLGDLPFIGKAFSSTEKRTQTLSRLFLITPRLIDPPANNSRSTRTAVDTLQKAFPVRNESLEPTASMKLDTQLQKAPR